MTDDRNQDQTFQGSSGAAGDPLAAAGEQLRAAGGRVAETTQALNQRILDQAESNVREAFAALRAAASAGSMGDVLKVQGDYVREQGARSMAQAKEIGDLIAGFGRDTMSGFTRS